MTSIACPIGGGTIEESKRETSEKEARGTQARTSHGVINL